MAKRVQFIGHNTAAADQFLGLDREVTLDTSVKTVRVHDGVTKGGTPLALASLVNVADAAVGVDGKMTSAQVASLTTVIQDTATNTSAVATNTNAIANNTQGVSNNASNIATNAAGIASNTNAINGKAALVSGTTNNLAALDTAGQLKDSGVSASSFAAASHTHGNLNASNTFNAGAVPVNRGGTGAGTFANGYTLVGSNTSAITAISPSTAGFVMTSNGVGNDPSYKAPATSTTLFQYTGEINTTNGKRGITINTGFGTSNFAYGISYCQRTDGIASTNVRLFSRIGTYIGEHHFGYAATGAAPLPNTPTQPAAGSIRIELSDQNAFDSRSIQIKVWAIRT